MIKKNVWRADEDQIVKVRKVFQVSFHYETSSEVRTGKTSDFSALYKFEAARTSCGCFFEHALRSPLIKN